MLHIKTIAKLLVKCSEERAAVVVVVVLVEGVPGISVKLAMVADPPANIVVGDSRGGDTSRFVDLTLCQMRI